MTVILARPDLAPPAPARCPSVAASPTAVQPLRATVVSVSLTEDLLGRGDDERFAVTRAFAAGFEHTVRAAGGRVAAVVDDHLTAVFSVTDAPTALAVVLDLVAGSGLRPAVAMATERIGVVGGSGVVGVAPARARRLVAIAPAGVVLADVDTLVATGRGLPPSDELGVLPGSGAAAPVTYQAIVGVPEGGGRELGAAGTRWVLTRITSWDPERTRGSARTDAGEHLYFDSRHVVRRSAVSARRRAFVVPRPPLVAGRNRVADPVLVVGQQVELVIEENHGGFGLAGLTTGPVDSPPLTVVDLGSQRPGTTVTAIIAAHRQGPVARVVEGRPD